MEFTTDPTVAAARPRALSPSTMRADWYTQRPNATDMRDRSVAVRSNVNDNCITRTAPIAAVAAVPAGGFGSGAAKQGAPPRGVPR